MSYLHEFQLFSKHFIVTFDFKDTFCDVLHKFYIIDLNEPMKDFADDFCSCYCLQFAFKVFFHTLGLKLFKFFSDFLFFWHLKNYDFLLQSRLLSNYELKKDQKRLWLSS